jgi:tRNA (guanine-N7-)-methyltransferase
MGRSRVKSSLKEAVVTYPQEIWSDSSKAIAQAGSWSEHFQNDWPIRLEIGMGRGAFLAQVASRGEQVNLIGVEVKADRCVVARQKILPAARSPFLLMNLTADLLMRVFRPGELDRIYLNFPDPWPNATYRDRRLFGSRFMRLYEGLLRDNGEFWFKSDHKPAWEELLVSLPQRFELKENGPDLHGADWRGEPFLTEYEERYIGQGKHIHFARLIKRPCGVFVQRVQATRNQDV